jgi:hypothetical protein
MGGGGQIASVWRKLLQSHTNGELWPIIQLSIIKRKERWRYRRGLLWELAHIIMEAKTFYTYIPS